MVPVPRGSGSVAGSREGGGGPGLLPRLDPGPGGRAVPGRRADGAPLVGVGARASPSSPAGWGYDPVVVRIARGSMITGGAAAQSGASPVSGANRTGEGRDR